MSKEKNSILNLPMEFRDRFSKAQFLQKKYKEILIGEILDVGADEMHLKNLLPENTKYTGIGFGSHKDLIQLDLEKGKLPFDNNSFNCVICMDVLEHLENIHFIFDELCRVSREYLIVGLPNPWAAYIECILNKPYNQNTYLKFYGLPNERETDRHKWFFSASEARKFVEYRSKLNGFEIIDIADKKGANQSFIDLIKANNNLFPNITDYEDFNIWSLWFTLKKIDK